MRKVFCKGSRRTIALGCKKHPSSCLVHLTVCHPGNVCLPDRILLRSGLRTDVSLLPDRKSELELVCFAQSLRGAGINCRKSNSAGEVLEGGSSAMESQGQNAHGLF